MEKPNLSETNGFRAIGATPFLCPIPAVMLGCADPENGARPNLITVVWAGVVCSKPPMLSVSIRKERYSHDIIRRTGEFTVNLIGQDLCRAMDFCGVKSGRDVDKFKTLSLTPVAAPPLEIAPGLGEAPGFLCCKVRSVTELGSHDLFLADIVEVHIADRLFAPDGSIREGDMGLVGYVHGNYRAVGEEVGFFGFSVASPEALKRRGYGR